MQQIKQRLQPLNEAVHKFTLAYPATEMSAINAEMEDVNQLAHSTAER